MLCNSVKIHLNSQLNALIDLQNELFNEDYATTSQIIGHIHNSIEWLKKYKEDKESE